MRFVIAFLIVFSSITLNAKSLDECKKDFTSIEQTTEFSHIDKKKSRRHKKANKRRKRACANWGKRSYAG